MIVGRCADYVLRNQKKLVRIFLYSDMNAKIQRAIQYYGLDKNKEGGKTAELIKKVIVDMDK